MELANATNGENPESIPLALLDPVRMDSQIYEFLLENKFAVHNDNGYLALEDLIDDNSVIFEHNFEVAVRKALGLIFNTADFHKMSTNKKRLRDGLLESYETPQRIVKAMASDHYLLIRVYTTFFKFRVKFYYRAGPDIRMQIFGGKSAPRKVRILFDSCMFYLLEKTTRDRDPEFCGGQERSPSPVSLRAPSRSSSPCMTVHRLFQNLANSTEEIFGFGDRQHIQLFEVSNSEISRSQISVRNFRSSKYRRHNPQNSNSSNSLKFKSDLISLQNKSSWSLVYNKSPENLSWADVGHSHDLIYSNTLAMGQQPVPLDSGVLLSYSVSRQCGFILTDSGLEVIVLADELSRAGVSSALLERSSDRIDKNVRFSLSMISSEPIATFEALGVVFTNLYLN
jgi:hypothetical protein